MTVRIGIIGPGGMGQAHIERITNLLSGGKVVAVTDLDPARAAKVAEPIGATVYPDGASLIAADEVDAVIVTSFGPAHGGSGPRSRGPAAGSSRSASCAATTRATAS